jgi:hypothetical protein
MRLFALLAVLLRVPGAAWAQAAYNDPKTPEGWAWAQIRNDRIANFNARCGREIDPHRKEGWDAPCRQVSPQFLVDILTKPKLRDQVGQHGAHIVGARIGGPIDLADDEIKPEVWIENSRIDGGLTLDDSRWARPFSLEGTTVAGDFSAERMHTDSVIRLRNGSTFAGAVNLRGAKIGGNLEMVRSSFAKGLSADDLSVKGDLFMIEDRFRDGGDLSLIGAAVDGSLAMNGSTFAKMVSANPSSVGGLLLMRYATFNGDVDLRNAKVGSNLEMDRSSFAEKIDARRSSISGLLLMETATFKGEVDLRNAQVGSNLEMSHSSFAKMVNANHSSVGGLLLMRDATFSGDVDLGGAAIGGNLEMDGSSFARKVSVNRLGARGSLFMRGQAAFGGDVDLTSATVGSNLEMDGSSFAGTVRADSVTTAGDLFMRSGVRFKEAVSLIDAKIGGNLDLRGATAASVDLSSAEAVEFLISGLRWWCPGGNPLLAANGGGGINAKLAPLSLALGDNTWRKAQCVGRGPQICRRLLCGIFMSLTFKIAQTPSPRPWIWRGFATTASVDFRE